MHVYVTTPFNTFTILVNPTRTLLVVSLLTLQCLRRFYETNFVSVFGKNARMHFIHYSLGFQHYTGCALAILGGASHFSKPYGKSFYYYYYYYSISKKLLIIANIFHFIR